MADSIGTLAAEKYYAAGLKTADALIAAFVDNFGPKGKGRATLMSSMDDLAAAMNRTATITVNTINTSTGGTTTDGSTAGTPGLTYNPTQNQDRNYGDQNPSLLNPAKAAITGSGQGAGSGEGQIPAGTVITINAPVTTTDPDPAAWAANLGWLLAKAVRE
jgi:hypothetical protein